MAFLMITTEASCHEFGGFRQILGMRKGSHTRPQAKLLAARAWTDGNTKRRSFRWVDSNGPGWRQPRPEPFSSNTIAASAGNESRMTSKFAAVSSRTRHAHAESI